jgi:hypothetical protein
VEAKVVAARRTVVRLATDAGATDWADFHVATTLQSIALCVTSPVGDSVCNCAAVIVLLLHGGILYAFPIRHAKGDVFADGRRLNGRTVTRHGPALLLMNVDVHLRMP